ncbi:MAG: YhjD/YihY/BrkB family envelope integrity protein [Prevotellaceae bacterium]|nr:YhjD/YihY/BrkB family envelope integrity protein [Prevotellaceae bacterium]MDY2749529.1 YhjD/YihY/BrkB family envelope integrity protein [Prevotella sp.]
MRLRNLISTSKLFIQALWADISQKRVIDTASNLTYSSLLAIVPIMAVVFAIARGFGYSILIEKWFTTTMASQPEVAEILITFVNSYLKHTQKGVFLGIGLVFMLWTVLMLISNIEKAFNDIWQVKRQRSIFRTVTDYIALLFLIPVVIVISSGLSIWVTALNHQLHDVVVIGPAMALIIELSPYVLLSTAFTALYTFMPNTKVRLRSAIVPGIIAGVSMQLFQLVYINSQIWISNYNAIYGSFAVLPFFLLWMQTSWIICLVGAEISFCRQNAEDFYSFKPQEPSFNSRLKMSWRIMELVGERFSAGEAALTALEIKKRIGIPMRSVNTLLYDLQRIHFVAEMVHDEKGDTAQYLPAEDMKNLTKEVLEERLANLGEKL